MASTLGQRWEALAVQSTLDSHWFSLLRLKQKALNVQTGTLVAAVDRGGCRQPDLRITLFVLFLFFLFFSRFSFPTEIGPMLREAPSSLLRLRRRCSGPLISEFRRRWFSLFFLFFFFV